MGIALALASALVVGGADFAGGIATRDNGATYPVVFLSQCIGLLTVLLVAPFIATSQLTASDLGWGAIAGIIGGTGLLFFYRALALGTMSIVSPVTAVVAALVPVVVGITQGERPALWASIGIVVAIGALALFGGGDHGDIHGTILQSLMPAVLAGFGFGAYFALVAQTHATSGLWPLVASRTTSCVLLGSGALIRRTPLRIRRDARVTLVLAGSGDITANALFLLASRRGDLAIVGVIASLYPASTLVLARFVLHERLGRLHQLAIALATIAVVLIAIG